MKTTTTAINLSSIWMERRSGYNSYAIRVQGIYINDDEQQVKFDIKFNTNDSQLWDDEERRRDEDILLNIIGGMESIEKSLNF